MEEEPKKEGLQPFGDVKNLALVRVVNLLFEVADLIYYKRYMDAVCRLQIAFRLLPPDIRHDLHEEEKKLDAIVEACTKKTITDFYRRLLAQHKTAAQSKPELLKIVSAVSELLYQRYLKTGFKGVDLSKIPVFTPDFEQEPDESEG